MPYEITSIFSRCLGRNQKPKAPERRALLGSPRRNVSYPSLADSEALGIPHSPGRYEPDRYERVEPATISREQQPPKVDQPVIAKPLEISPSKTYRRGTPRSFSTSDIIMSPPSLGSASAISSQSPKLKRSSTDPDQLSFGDRKFILHTDDDRLQRNMVKRQVSQHLVKKRWEPEVLDGDVIAKLAQLPIAPKKIFIISSEDTPKTDKIGALIPAKNIVANIMDNEIPVKRPISQDGYDISGDDAGFKSLKKEWAQRLRPEQRILVSADRRAPTLAAESNSDYVPKGKIGDLGKRLQELIPSRPTTPA